MKRSSSPSGLILVVVFLVLAVLFLRHVLTPYRAPSRPPPGTVPYRAYTGKRYGEHDRSPRGHGSRYSQPAGKSDSGHGGSCSALGVACTSEYFADWTEPSASACRTLVHNGYPVPDPRCTPGGVNPSITEKTLRDPDWRTRCVRNCETSEAEKHVSYAWYGLATPRGNSGENQVCELDHLVPLELGGADGLGNLWPECGPDGAALDERDFKRKDRVENYLAEQVRTGRVSLDSAQRGIATDWPQFLDAANHYCSNGGRCEVKAAESPMSTVPPQP